MIEPTVGVELKGFYTFARSQGLHSVYVMHSPGNEFCKVGIADEPYRRIRGLQGGNWSKIEVYDHWWTVDCSLSRRVEAEVLNRMAEHRAMGEWIKCSPEDLAAEVEAAAADLKIGLMRREDLEPIAEEWLRAGTATEYLTNNLRTR